jgi:hypothetical protein
MFAVMHVLAKYKVELKTFKGSIELLLDPSSKERLLKAGVICGGKKEVPKPTLQLFIVEEVGIT